MKNLLMNGKEAFLVTGNWLAKTRKKKGHTSTMPSVQLNPERRHEFRHSDKQVRFQSVIGYGRLGTSGSLVTTITLESFIPVSAESPLRAQAVNAEATISASLADLPVVGRIARINSRTGAQCRAQLVGRGSVMTSLNFSELPGASTGTNDLG
jgi:hypothetical protein